MNTVPSRLPCLMLSGMAFVGRSRQKPKSKAQLRTRTEVCLFFCSTALMGGGS